MKSNTASPPATTEVAGSLGVIERLLIGVPAAASLLVVRFVDPFTPGSYPVCPSLSLFGVYCPLCGGLRSTHALLSGDVGLSLRMNLLVPLGLVVIVLLAVRRWTAWELRLPAVIRSRAVMVVGVLLLVVFGIARNFTGWALSLADLA